MDPAADQPHAATNTERLARFSELSQGREEQLAKLLDHYRVHVHIVAHDFNMIVRYGEPLGGFFFIHSPATTVLDPAEALLDPQKTEFAAGHEGAHRYNTFSYLHPDIEPVLGEFYPVRQLSTAVGFNAIFNGIEDPTINRWYGIVYPGSREGMNAVYARMFKDDDARLYTPEIQLCEALVGTYPKFGQYVSQVIRKWFTGAWSEELDPQVRAALAETAPAVERMIPMTVEQTGAPEVMRIQLGIRRYLQYLEGVWPVVKRLVADDLNEAGYQAFRRAADASQSGLDQWNPQPEGTEPGPSQREQPGTPERPGADAPPQPAGGSPESDQAEPRSGQGQGAADPQSPPNADPAPGSGGGKPQPTPAQPGGKNAIDDLINGLPPHLKEQLKELLRTMKGAPGKAEEAKQPAAAGTGMNAAAARPGSTQTADGRPGQGEARPPNSPAEPGAPNGNGAPGPVTGEDQELRAFYRELYPQQRGGFEERGKFNLQRFEDAINEFLRSGLVPYGVPSHGERELASQIRARSDSQQRSHLRASAELEEYRRQQMGAWELALDRQGQNIQQLTNIIRRILKPVVPERTGGHRSGSALSLPHVLQDEQRVARTFKIFEQTTMPLERHYFFQIVADRSGSMLHYGKNHRNLEAVVLASEVLQRVRTPFEIASFDSSFAMLKKGSEPFGLSEKEAIAQTLLDCDGGTADYAAIDEMAKRARSVNALYKVMLIPTDGGSNNETLLAESIRRCGEQGIIVIGFGLGDGTSFVDRNYPNGRGNLSLEGFESANSFVDYFRRTIEAIVRNPQQFRYFKK